MSGADVPRTARSESISGLNHAPACAVALDPPAALIPPALEESPAGLGAGGSGALALVRST